MRWHVLQNEEKECMKRGTNLMRGSYENCVDINAKQIACIGQICKKQDAQYTRCMSKSSLCLSFFPFLRFSADITILQGISSMAIARYRKIKWKSRYQASTYRILEHHISHPIHISWWCRKTYSHEETESERANES